MPVAHPVAAATMTLARDPVDAARQLESMRRLAAAGFPVFATDGGSAPEFARELERLPGVDVRVEGSTLVQQVRSSLARAARHHETIVYSEPDKGAFFECGLPELASRALEGGSDIVVASRDQESFATFPAGQRSAESAFNLLAEGFLGPVPDLLYGPFALRADVVRAYMDRVPDDLGWGWRIYVLARAVLAGRPVDSLTGSFACPPDQRAEDDGKARLYRLQQLRQNVDGLRLALRDASG